MAKNFQTLWNYVFWTACAVWLIGFSLFSISAIMTKYIPLEKSDAIIVLTGGTDRIQKGLNLLQSDYADLLFISGVNKSVKEADFLNNISPETKEKVFLGYMADSTHTNAIETAEWIQEKKSNKIILLTSFYHMPRALKEIRHYLPKITIIPHSVFPKQFDESTHWLHTKYAWQLFLEYHKFLVVYFKYLM